MHGLIFVKLRCFAEQRIENDSWDGLLKAAGYEGSMYLSMGTYPDEELFSLIHSASRLSSVPISELLNDFGQFLAPDLIRLYQHSIRPEWKALDLLENVESTVHRAVRGGDPNAAPPELECTRISPKRVEIRYFSGRKLCDFARGLILGIIRYYGEDLSVQELTCQKANAPGCIFRIS
jgi:predicted hydrocarbon binding protein